MAGTESGDLEVIAGLLAHAGVTAERLDEGSEERCDYRARDAGADYLIEVKGLHDGDALQQALRDRKDFSHARPTLDLGTAHTVARKALSQMDRSAHPERQEFRVVAFVVRTTFSPGVTETQVLGSLYGVRNILGVREDGTHLHARCLYFAESIFFRHKTLDAAILVDANGGAAMFANDHSARHNDVMRCGLASWFGRHGGLNNAEGMERDGGFVLADCGVDRKSPAGVLAYMKSKLGLRTALDLHFVEYSAMGVVRPVR